MVGMSGAAEARFAPVTASARALPSRIWPRIAARPGIAADTWPPRRSVTAWALPLYGIWFIWMPAMEAKRAMKRCCALPLPEDE